MGNPRGDPHQFKYIDDGWAVADYFRILINELPKGFSPKKNSGLDPFIGPDPNWVLVGVHHGPLLNPSILWPLLWCNAIGLNFVGWTTGWREVCRIWRANACDSKRGWSLGSPRQTKWGSSAHQLFLIGSWPPYAKIMSPAFVPPSQVVGSQRLQQWDNGSDTHLWNS